MNQSKSPTIVSLWTEFFNDPSEERFTPFYETTQSLVYTICYRVLRNQDDAYDAFQATYARLLALARDQAENSNIAIDQLVSRFAYREADALRKRRNRLAQKEIVVDEPLLAVDDGPSAQRIASSSEIKERVAILISSLPNKLRVPIMLYYYDGMSKPEISAALDTPVSTVANRIRKAIQILRPKMKREGLGEAISLFTAIGAGAHLLSPPSTAAASTVYAGATSKIATLEISTVSPIKILMATLKGVKTAVVLVSTLLIVGGAIWIFASRALPDRSSSATSEPSAATTSAGSTPIQNSSPLESGGILSNAASAYRPSQIVQRLQATHDSDSSRTLSPALPHQRDRVSQRTYR